MHCTPGYSGQPLVHHKHQRCRLRVARECRGCACEGSRPLKVQLFGCFVPSPPAEAVSRIIAVLCCPTGAITDGRISVEGHGPFFCSSATHPAMAVSIAASIARRWPPEASRMLSSKVAELSQLVENKPTQNLRKNSGTKTVRGNGLEAACIPQ